MLTWRTLVFMKTAEMNEITRPPVRTEELMQDSKKQCIGCGKDCTKVLQCGRCKTAIYCGRTCQREHWTYHKQQCQGVTRAACDRGQPREDNTAADAGQTVARTHVIASRIQELMAEHCGVPKDCNDDMKTRMYMMAACKDQVAAMIPFWRRLERDAT